MNASLPGTDLAVDEDGHLLNPESWTPEMAATLAAASGLSLDERHWEILQAARDFYTRFQRSPATRPLLKYLAQTLGPEKATSIYVMQLFGGGTQARTIARLAGLPKPPNCL
ncbi:MAG TPA: TusE/DsrC/DsvC family sulfur relay protein [Fluviicoccus sp.]|nr:TusE/DsrC/DsvC family sulfur relay protein [Fluviicoccus sp.]